MDDERTTYTPNQVVAANLRKARKDRGWKQRDAAEAVSRHIGERWSPEVFSAVERSVTGARVRKFTADDLLALARAFELPVAYFLFPPEEAGAIRTREAPDAPTLTPQEYVEAFYLVSREALYRQFEDYLDAHVAEEERSALAQRLADEVALRVEVLVGRQLGGRVEALRRAQDALDSASDALRDVVSDVEAATRTAERAARMSRALESEHEQTRDDEEER